MSGGVVNLPDLYMDIKYSMRLFLQIDIGTWQQRSYYTPLVAYASSLASDLMGTDIDNESEASVIDLVIKLAEQASSIFIFIAITSESALGGADKMMQYLIRHESNIHQIAMVGEHATIEKLCQNFPGRFLNVENQEDVKKLLRDFAEKIA